MFSKTSVKEFESGAATAAPWRGAADATYKVGGVVPESGFYVCIPCGSKRYFRAGKHFPSCLSCFGKEKRFFRKGLELWERIFEQ